MWNMKYYFNGCPSWNHFYRYREAPTFHDLAIFVRNNDLNNMRFRPSKPYTQLQQMMMILPPGSKKLLPKKYADMMDNELCQYYPTEFKLEKMNKNVEWQWSPILPYINEADIFKYVKE